MRGLTGKRLELTLNLIKRMKDDTEASVSIEVAMSLVYTIEALQQENEQLQAECDGKERYTIELFNRTKEAEDEVE